MSSRQEPFEYKCIPMDEYRRLRRSYHMIQALQNAKLLWEQVSFDAATEFVDDFYTRLAEAHAQGDEV